MSKNLSKKNTLKFDDNNTLQIMCGVYHSNLDVIEKKLNVSLSSRGNLISILGNQIFKKPLIELAPKGCINLHTALLPKYRGLMPTFWVLKNNPLHQYS